MSYNVAVVGATGAVGREMLQTLFERKFPIKNIYALASRSSVGKEVSFGDNKILKVSSVDDFNFEKADIALFSAGSDIAKKFGPKAGVKGCIVIDNSSCFRMDDKVPLIVPEVNPEAINSYKNKNSSPKTVTEYFSKITSRLCSNCNNSVNNYCINY